MINTKIAFVPRQVDFSVVDSFYYCAAGFVDVAAVVEATLVHQLAHFGKEVAELLFFNVDNT